MRSRLAAILIAAVLLVTISAPVSAHHWAGGRFTPGRFVYCSEFAHLPPAERPKPCQD